MTFVQFLDADITALKLQLKRHRTASLLIPAHEFKWFNFQVGQDVSLCCPSTKKPEDMMDCVIEIIHTSDDKYSLVFKPHTT